MSPGEVAGRRLVRGRLLWRVLKRDGGIAVHTFDEPAEPGERPVLVARTVLHIDGDMTLFATPALATRADLSARHDARVAAQVAVLQDLAGNLGKVQHYLRGAMALGGSVGTAALAHGDPLALGQLALSVGDTYLLGGAVTAGLTALPTRLLRPTVRFVTKSLFGA